MNSKKVNLAFLISIILYIACVLGAAFVFPKLMESLVMNNLFCETLMVLPGLLFAFFSERKISGGKTLTGKVSEGKAPEEQISEEKTSKENLSDFLHLKRMKISTLLVLIPFTFLSMPVITLANLVSQFFVENEAAAVMESYQIADMPLALLILSVGVFAPFCEELVCRGVYYRGYKKSGSAWKAMCLSALLFALMHMNVNQAMYAFVMGILAALLTEAAGSLWASVIYHALINSSQIFIMYSMLTVNPVAYSEAAAMMDMDTMVLSLSVYLVITAVSLPAAWALLVWMSGNEGRRGVLLRLWKDRKNTGERLITVPLVLALLLCIVMIVWPYLLNLIR